MYWQIKRISVEKKDDPKKFDKIIFAIRQPKSVRGYSTILWDVRNFNVKQDKTKILFITFRGIF